MNERADAELLREYAENQSEGAFSELVRRHVDFVYSAALRMVLDSDLAKDVTQATFLALAQRARQLAGHPVLSGWLHRTAQNISAQTVRTNARRHVREQEAAVMNELTSVENDSLWERIAPQLDRALDELGEADRDALLLRYFERKSAREMAQVLGTSEEAAQKRVTRALERLRDLFSKRGIAIGSAGIVALISSHAIQAAPAGLSTSISTAAALTAAAINNAATIGSTTNIIAMTTVQKVLIVATLAAAFGTGIYEARQISGLREHLQGMVDQQKSIEAQRDQAQKERDSLAKKLASARFDGERSQANATEIARLRAEVARLQGDTRELSQMKAANPPIGVSNDPGVEAALRSWASRASQLKQRLDQMPEKKIPELALLTEKDWLDAVKNTSRLESDEEYRQAFNNLRALAKSEFGQQMRVALPKYAQEHEGMTPTDMTQLKPYFDRPVDEAMLQRYSLKWNGKLSEMPPETFLVVESAPPVDDEYDLYYQYRMNGTRSSTVSKTDDAMKQAVVAYATANNGRLPTDPAHITPYLQQTIDVSRMQKFLSKIPTGAKLEQLRAAGVLPK